MGAIDDVLAALKMQVIAALNAANLANGLVGVGWPDANDLATTLAAGKFEVTIYPLPTSRNSTTSLNPVIVAKTRPVHTLTATVTGQSITFGGTATAGQGVFVLYGSPTQSARVTMAANDTPTTIVAALASAIGSAATASGSTLTLSGAIPPRVRIAGQGTRTVEARRENRQVQVSIWAPSPQLRSQVISALEGVVGNAYSPRLTYGDGQTMMVQAASSQYLDRPPGDDNVYVYHLVLSVDYGITYDQTVYEIGEVDISAHVSIGSGSVNSFELIT